MKTRKKLIEVALPLNAINRESVRESFIYRDNPSAVHKWWAQRPLAACRTVLFASLVDDPSAHPDLFPTEQAQESERQRLFRIIESLAVWENTTNEQLLAAAQAEILNSTNGRTPAFYDPFCGGGSIPLEAQRLGLSVTASDLNPVAVLITKALIEIPAKFAERTAVNPAWKKISGLFPNKCLGLKGLADDIRYYGERIRAEAEHNIGHLYPKYEVTFEIGQERPEISGLVGKKLPILAWLWARTVKSPNPAFSHTDVPLVSTFILSSKSGKEVYLEPVIQGDEYSFRIRTGKSNDEKVKNGTKLSRGANFRCILSDTPIPSEHIYNEARAGRMGARLLAVVADGDRSRLYLPATLEMEACARAAKPEWVPDLPIATNPRAFSPPLYGFKTYGEIFTSRQLVALTTFADLIDVVRKEIKRDAIASGQGGDLRPLAEGGGGAEAYADAVAMYLAFAVDKTAEYGCTLVPWYAKEDRPKGVFARQALPMVWDYAEINPLGGIGGTLSASLKIVAGSLEGCCPGARPGQVFQSDAVVVDPGTLVVVSTDPPYYDNIPYADLSDFFYVWLRRSLRSVFPDLFATVAVPKSQELVATPYRHGSKEAAEAFFMDRMTQAVIGLRKSVIQSFRSLSTTHSSSQRQEATEQPRRGGKRFWMR